MKIKVFLTLVLVISCETLAQVTARTKTGSFQPVGARSEVPSLFPTLSISVRLVDSSGNNALDAEESGELVFTVVNTGQRTAEDLSVKLTPLSGATGVRVGAIARVKQLAGGDSVTLHAPLVGSTSIADGVAKYRVEVLEKGGFDLDPPAEISFTTRKHIPANLILADIGIDDQNRNRIIEPRELVEITARIQNISHGRARGASATIRFGENVFLAADSDSTFELGDLGPGEYKDISFSVYTNSRATGVPVWIALEDQFSMSGKTEPLNLQFNRPQKRPTEFKMEGKELQELAIAVAPGILPDVDVSMPKTDMSNNDAIAVVIGNRNYVYTKPVAFATYDAASVRRYLINVLGYREANIFYLENCSKSQFELYFGTKDQHRAKLFNAVKHSQSDVFVFYSGHGAPGLQDKKGYFVPVECDPQYVEVQGYPLDVFYQNLAKIPARSVAVVLDACFSGAGLIENISPIIISIETPAVAIDNGVILTSSSGDQVSSWYEEMKHGMFTYFFLKAIHERNGDVNKDGNLTFEEIHHFVSDKTEGVPYYARRYNNIDQMPMISGPAKDRVFVKY